MNTYKKQGIIERFLAEVAAHPEAQAVVDEKVPENALSYAGLLKEMERFKGLFDRHGISENEQVALILPPGWEFIAALYGAISAGGVALCLNNRLTAYEMGNIVNDANPVGVVTTAETYATHRALFEQASDLRFVISIDDPVETPHEHITCDVLKECKKVASPLVPPQGNPVSTCHYTYRGCGFPLGVPHRYKDYILLVDGMESRFPLQPGDAVLIGLPIYPIYGISIMVFFPLSLGCKLVIADKFMDQNFVDAFEKHRVMMTCLVPLIIPKLALELKNRGGRKNLAFNPYILVISSATRLPKSIQDEIAECSGIEFVQGYGMTEALAVSATYRRIEPERGTMGVLLHEDIQVRIVDGKGRDVPTGRLGEILIGGPTVTEGFLGKPEVNKRFFRDGFFHTGDLGYVDERGYLNFEGRALPIAKVAAQMVDLVELEQVLGLHPDVIRAKAVEKRVPIGRNFVSASVRVRENSELTPQKLQAFVRDYLSLYKVPAQVTVLSKEAH